MRESGEKCKYKKNNSTPEESMKFMFSYKAFKSLSLSALKAEEIWKLSTTLAEKLFPLFFFNFAFATS
jgi:hypothetical protein